METQLRIPIPRTILERRPGFWDPAVAVDFDGTVAEFDALMENYVNQRRLSRSIRSSVQLRHSGTYYFYRDPGTRLDKTECGECLREIAQASKGGMGQQEFYPGARKALKVLKQNGVHPFIMTQVPGALDTSEAHDQRQSWGTAQKLREKQLMDEGLISVPEDVIFCSAHEKPFWMLDKGYHIPLLVDDRVSTLVSASRDHGLIAVGIRTSTTRHNQGEYEGIVWFRSLAQAVPAIKQIFVELQDRCLLSKSTHIKRSPQ